MLALKIEARIPQELATRKTDRTRSRHRQRLLHGVARKPRRARLQRRHRSDRDAGAGEARQARGITNATLATGDAASGWGKHAPYDVIVLTGSVPSLVAGFPAGPGTGWAALRHRR
ncbi:MAG: hypothetical protein U1E63_13610 [Burkholderiales bacterium]